MTMQSSLSGIKRVGLIMGAQCNISCSMCYLRSYGLKSDMPQEIYEKHLMPLYPTVKYIMIDGGEVTVMPQCKELVCVLAPYAGIEFEVCTNGVCVDEFWMNVLRRKTNIVNFSLNAATPQTYERIVKNGDFHRVLNTVRAVIKGRKGKKPFVSVSAVLLRHNVSEIAQLISLGHEVGADRVKFSVDPVLSFQGDIKAQVREELCKARDIVNRTGISVRGLHVIARCLGRPWNDGFTMWGQEPCSLPFTDLIVDQRGDVRVCCLSWRVIGNTYGSSLESILEGSPRVRFQKKISSGDYSWCPENCWENPLTKKIFNWDKYFYWWHKNPKELFRNIMELYNRSRVIS